MNNYDQFVRQQLQGTLGPDEPIRATGLWNEQAILFRGGVAGLIHVLLLSWFDRSFYAVLTDQRLILIATRTGWWGRPRQRNLGVSQIPLDCISDLQIKPQGPWVTLAVTVQPPNEKQQQIGYQVNTQSTFVTGQAESVQALAHAVQANRSAASSTAGKLGEAPSAAPNAGEMDPLPLAKARNVGCLSAVSIAFALSLFPLAVIAFWTYENLDVLVAGPRPQGVSYLPPTSNPPGASGRPGQSPVPSGNPTPRPKPTANHETPPPSPDAPGAGEQYLTTLEPVEVLVLDREDLRIDKPIVIQGIPFDHSVFMHPPERNSKAVVVYRLGGDYSVLRGAIGLNDQRRTLAMSNLTFHVLSGEEALWSSRPLKAVGDWEPFEVDVSGVDELSLVVECPLSHTGAHGAWMTPILVK